MLWVASPITSQIIRAEFRVMYFVHGNSTTYNFPILKHMFINGSELRATDGPFVRLRVLVNLEDNYKYPLFTTKLLANELAIVRYIWSIMNDIWWQIRYCEVQDDRVNEPVKFLVTVYATWAYNQIRQSLDARPATTRSQDVYERYEDAFSADRIVRECEATRGEFTMRIANKRVRADDLFNVKDASTSFANIARLCVNMRDDALRAFYNVIEAKFDLFPMRLIDSRVNYYTWSLVGNTTRTYDGRALTSDHMREKLSEIKRSATSNVDIVRRNDDDDDDDDNNVVVTTTLQTREVR